MSLDDDLRRAFRRKPVPPHFSDDVLARIAHGDHSTDGTVPPERLPSPRTVRRAASARRWLAAAAVLTLMTAAAARYYVHQRTAAAAERVKAEIRVALQITSEKLALAQRKVQDAEQ